MSAETRPPTPAPGAADRNEEDPLRAADAPSRLPPVGGFGVVSVVLMLSGGVYLAAYLPHPPPLGPAIGLLAGGAVLSACAVAMLFRIRAFAWSTFFLVARWALAAYAVIAGILGFVFIYDRTPASTLAVLILTLVVFALDVPLIIAFTVARYDQATLRPSARR